MRGSLSLKMSFSSILRTHLCLRHQNEEQIFGLWHGLVFIHTGSEANNLIHAKWACLSNCPFYHTTSIKNNLPYLWGASTVWNLFLEWICHILARKNKMIISIKRGRVVAVIELAIPKNQAPQKSMKYVLINYRPWSLKKHSLTINGQSLLCGHKQRQGALLIGWDFMTLPWVSLPLNDHIIKDNQRMIRYTDRQGWIEGRRETRGWSLCRLSRNYSSGRTFRGYMIQYYNYLVSHFGASLI